MYLLLCVGLLFVACNAQEKSTEKIIVDICNIRYGYYKIGGSCDAYIECKDYYPSRMLCPDGLNFNLKARWPMYPCSYPADAPCYGRETTQPANPTADCPRQNGFFRSPLANSNDCGQYRLCADGRAYDMFCPFGLAFDTVRSRCDWPDLVPECNTGEYIGYVCPPAEYDVSGYPIVTNYRFENDCYMFYSCEAGRARLLSCDLGLAFDSYLGRCVEAHLVKCDTNSTSEEVESVEN